MLDMRRELEDIGLNAIEKYLIALLLLTHVSIASYIGLSPDEAHYALYAKYLDWSYYDHPPMVGWIQYVFLKISPSELSLRMVPMGSWLLTLFLLLKMGVKIRRKVNPQGFEGFEQRGVRPEMVVFALSPMLHLLSVALVPDTLLIPLVLMLMMATWNLLEVEDSPGSHWWNWIQLGVLLGLAGLTKYTAVVFVISIGILLLQKFGWRLLLNRQFWTCCAIALILIMPVLFWNYQHAWISFEYQLNHAAGASEWLIRKCIVFIVVLVLVYGPLAMMGFGFKRGIVQVENKSIIHFFLLFSIPFLAFLIYLSGRGSTLPHWAAPAIVALIPLSAIELELFKRQFKNIFKILLSVQLICTLGLGVLLLRGGVGEELGEQKFSSEQSPASYAKNNPFADLFGWDEAGELAKKLLEKNKIDKIVVSNWTLASRIAWYASPSPVNLVDNRQDQFAIWFGTLKENESALWIDWSMMPFGAPVSSNQFKSCEHIDQLPIVHWGRQIAHFNFAICKGWQSIN